MKKNMILVIILALLIVNIVLTGITMFSITSTNRKTAAVVSDIATALSLDVANAADETAGTESTVSLENTAVYNITDSMTIQLKSGEDGKPHYCVATVSISMDTTNPDYTTYSATMSDKEGLIKNEINEAFASYTMDEAQADPDAVRADIVQRLQKLFNSKFIYDVAFSSLIYQ